MTDHDQFPRVLLADVPWDFENQTTYATQGDFEDAVDRHWTDVAEDYDQAPDDQVWRKSEIVLGSPIVNLRYYADPENGQRGFHEEILTSNDARGFTAGELLFKVHNATVTLLATAGHHWFEGLTFEDVRGDIPRYTLIGGS